MEQWQQVTTLLQTMAGDVRGDRTPRQVYLTFAGGLNILVTLEPSEFMTPRGRMPVVHIDNTND
jgi:hypothetical protein